MQNNTVFLLYGCSKKYHIMYASRLFSANVTLLNLSKVTSVVSLSKLY